VVEPGKKAYNQVVEAFGPQVPDLLDETGKLNRPALGKAVFGNSDRLKILNKIIHGAVKREMARQVFWAYVSGANMVILDVPLLFEAGLHRVCGATISVSTDSATQLKRLLERNPELSEEDAKKRISSQLSMDERNSKADKVIDNNGTLEELHQKIASIVDDLRPSRLWTVLDWFPPFGFVVGAVTIATRTVRDFLASGKAKTE
ncbi:hypothetical protein JCM33374_g5230, partial [Metschnikowia sp. JCM 33374]